MISVPANDTDVFVHVPPRLDQAYLGEILSRKLDRRMAIRDCTTTNLCAWKWGKVSNSGATVLRLSLTFDDGTTRDVVAKILSPDPVNLFKIDTRFSARLREIAWADWWGQQDVPWVPVTYGTRADIPAREFWVIQEFFPQIGWPGFKLGSSDATGRFSAEDHQVRDLLRQVAVLHAYSRSRIKELRDLFPVGDAAPVDACPAPVLRRHVQQATADPDFLRDIGVTDDERAGLDAIGERLAEVPAWVEEWDEVCVTADWRPDNFAIRDGTESEPITFDWGTTRLGPMEEDIDVLLGRIMGLDAAMEAGLLAHYLDTYFDRAGRRIDGDAFRSRLPWARFFVTLRYLLGHLEALRWVPHQTRSREFVHLFVGLCWKQIAQCRTG